MPSTAHSSSDAAGFHARLAKSWQHQFQSTTAEISQKCQALSLLMSEPKGDRWRAAVTGLAQDLVADSHDGLALLSALHKHPANSHDLTIDDLSTAAGKTIRALYSFASPMQAATEAKASLDALIKHGEAFASKLRAQILAPAAPATEQPRG